MTTTKDLAEALRELIALKDLKEGAMERSIKASMSKGANPSERYHEWNADYKRRKPLAWDAARVALASHDAAQSAGEAPVPVARRVNLHEGTDQPPNWQLIEHDKFGGNGFTVEALYSGEQLAQARSAAPPSPAVERDERAEFEAWAANAYTFTNPGTLTRDKSGTGYFYGPIKSAWESWQARAALEGEKP